MHVAGLSYLMGLFNSCDGYVGTGPGGKYGKNTGEAPKKMTLPLSGASKPTIVTRERGITSESHDKDTSGKDSTFTQEKRALGVTQCRQYVTKYGWWLPWS